MGDTFNKAYFKKLIFKGETEKAFEYCEKFAQFGDNDALIGLSECYFRGIGVLKNAVKAFSYAKEAAVTEEGVLQLSKLLLYGIGVKRDPQKAVDTFKRLALEKDPVACYYLARCYREGTGVEKNMSYAEMLFKISADAENSDAMCSLCELYIDGKAECDDKEKVEALATRALHAYNLNAVYVLGRIAESGFTCKSDPALADSFYIKGADLGNKKCIIMACRRISEKLIKSPLDDDTKFTVILTGAQLYDKNALRELARCVYGGVDLKKLCGYIEKTRPFISLAKERKRTGIKISSDGVLLQLLYNACESEYVPLEMKSRLMKVTGKLACSVKSLKGLGKSKMQFDVYLRAADDILTVDEKQTAYEMFRDGRCVKKNRDSEMYFLKSAYEAGSPSAMFALGELYEFGSKDFSIEQDKDRALHLFEEASQLGERRSMRKLAIHYKNKYSGRYDPMRARELFSRASVSDPRAMYELGICCEKGLGGCKDIERAKKLYENAVAHGSTPAKARLAEILFTGSLNCKKDEQRAYGLLKSTVSDKRDTCGLALLGTMYYNGIVVEKNTDEGMRLYNTALGGRSSMLAKLGIYIGEEAKELEARIKRAGKGDGNAAMELYGAYRYGLGTDPDPVLAENWLFRAAELKNKNAVYKVGRWFSAEEISNESIGDMSMFDFCMKNARLSRRAEYNLAMCYFTGRGVGRDLKIALDIFSGLMFEGMNDDVSRILAYALSECRDALSLYPDAEMVEMLERAGIKDSFALYKLGRYLEEGKIACGEMSSYAAAAAYYRAIVDEEKDARAYMALQRCNRALGISDTQPLREAASLNYGEALLELFNKKDRFSPDYRSIRASLKADDTELMKRAVLQGEKGAAYELGVLYTHDFYNPYIALLWLDRACKTDADERACILASGIYLGDRYFEIIENREKAKFYLSEYGKDSPAAMTEYAKLLDEEGKYREAVAISAEAASNNNADAYLLLASLCERGLADGCSRENTGELYMKAAELFRKENNNQAAENAEFLLGRFLYENGGLYGGKMLPEKSGEALLILRQAAERGIPDAMAVCAVTGDTPDLELLRVAAEKGSEKAALILIDIYSEKGSCDSGKLLKYCELAEKAGNKDAFYRLGKLYEDGDVLSQDYITARRCYSRAAMMGNDLARARLAEFYKNGIGGMADVEYAKLLEE